MYMVPPFIAYFGALEGGDGERALLQVAYDQCRLYREGLRDDGGLWRHVALGTWEDPTHWATGAPLIHHALKSNFFQGMAGQLRECYVFCKH